MKKFSRTISLIVCVMFLSTSMAFADSESINNVGTNGNLLAGKPEIKSVVDEYFSAREDALNKVQTSSQNYTKDINSIVKTDNTELMALESKRLDARSNMAQYHGVYIINAESIPKVQEVKAVTKSGYSDAYELAIKEWTWIYYNDGNGGLVDEMGYSVEHKMTVAKDLTGDYKILSNEYDDDMFIGEAVVSKSLNDELDEEGEPDDAATMRSIDTSSLNVNNIIRYADLYVGVDCINSNGYNSAYKNMNPVGGDCANYVSQCLRAGGLTDDTVWYCEKESGSSIYNDMAPAWKLAVNLRDYFQNTHGCAYVNAASSNVFPGNPVYCYVTTNVAGYKHVGICVGYNHNGVPIINAHNNDIYHMPYTYFTVSGNGPKTVKIFTTNKLGDIPDENDKITLSSSGTATKTLTIPAGHSRYIKIGHPSGTSSRYTANFSNTLTSSTTKGYVYLYQQLVGSNQMYERKFSCSSVNGGSFSFSYNFNPSYSYYLRYYTNGSGSRTINVSANVS